MKEVHRREVLKNGEEVWQLVQASEEARQETLDSEAVFDEMNAEQTWPTEEELSGAQVKVVKKKVPKGTSEYQAAWILDSDEEEIEEDSGEESEAEEDGDSDEGDDDDDDEEEEEEEEEDDEDEEEMETVSLRLEGFLIA